MRYLSVCPNALPTALGQAGDLLRSREEDMRARPAPKVTVSEQMRKSDADAAVVSAALLKPLPTDLDQSETDCTFPASQLRL
jgi:hypothetical protein